VKDRVYQPHKIGTVTVVVFFL